MSRKIQTLGVPNSNRTLAVSDGELNMMDLDGHGSCRSLDSEHGPPSSPAARCNVGRVASWAVSFERLLQDPTGVHYFTAFLKSEVSAENIFFWQACEKFRQIKANQKEELIQEARSIYDSYLSHSASHAINIDDTARVNESDLQSPTPDMFQRAQQQIFKLMKFDSYTRFIRSQLFQNCMLADVEGRPLSELGAGSRSPAMGKATVPGCPAVADVKKKKKARAGKSQALEMEDAAALKESKGSRDKRREQRGSWGELSDHRAVLRSQSDCTVKTMGVVEIAAAYNKSENGRSGQRDAEQGRSAVGRVDKYCCVFLPDGTASLAPTRPGLTIRDMLMGLCEKRRFALRDVIIYLQGKEKQPLSLDQDSSVLKEQQIFLELRVTFTVEIAFTGKTVGIMVKSSKTLQEALSTLLQKYCLKPQDTVITESGCKETLNMNMMVFSLANKKLVLDRVKGKEQSSKPQITAQTPSNQGQSGPTSTRNRKTNDMDGFVSLLTRAQWCSVDDQRGLLRKEHLVLPQFLQLPEGEGKQEEKRERQADTGRDQDPSPAPITTAAPKPTPESPLETGLKASGALATPSGAESEAESSDSLPWADGSFFCTDSRETVV
ncbi:regulator of G-protein signaling 14-like isoform X2 [Megalops cyprinoides]|uniref:regulator of G-protein signaling 14-like isoform X2 n=1 Tax=Megalops cyprinoides TaxID=118141 RepID=UPI0018641003|nr:regulator of G-protein signaling 14-like isoform X2 [Megalops cyprinoides]